MKIMCQKSLLLDAVVNVSKAVSERNAMPTLEGIKVRVDGNNMELTGYDLEIGIRSNVLISSGDRGDFLVNARLFTEVIRKMPDDNILIEVAQNLMLTISSGKTTFNIQAVSADEYPSLPDTSRSEKITVSQPILKSMITETVFAVAVVDSKPVLKGELFEIENNVLNVVAIDGYRLAVRTESISYDGEIKFVVPAKTLTEVSKLLDDDDADMCDIYVSKKHIIFDVNGYLVYSRLLEGEFHPYRSAIPKTSTTEVVVDRRELIQSLERAVLLISDRAPSPVRCYFENGTVRVNCSTALGKISDEIKADISGSVIEIGFKCKYLSDPLKVISDDKVKMLMGGSLLPLKIVPLNGDSYTYLVLPVRLSKD